MQIIEVKTPQTCRQFIDFPKKLYLGDNNYTCPLDIEVENIFNPDKNSLLQKGGACRWILKNDQNEVIGRIAAFYNIIKANVGHNKQPTGGIGFFDCVNNQTAANKLFDIAKAWLASKGMQAMDGPVNFGENYVNQGLLVEGFMHQAYGMPYNFPYYRALFENYGFKTYFEMYSYHVDLTKPFSERQEKFARFVMRKPEYRWDHLRFENQTKYMQDAADIYNAVWSHFHEDYVPLTGRFFEKAFLEAKALINPEFIVFAYDGDKPIGMIICLPDINQVLKKIKNGKLTLLNKLKIIYYKKNSITRARQLLSGVIPEYQKSGIIGPLFLNMADALKKHGITELEMSWVGDYNHTVNKMYKQMDNAYKAKTHLTMRYLFNQQAPFERFENNVKQTDEY